jgi:hypothetical protein
MGKCPLQPTSGRAKMAENSALSSNENGGSIKARELFGNELEPLINELNGCLIA